MLSNDKYNISSNSIFCKISMCKYLGQHQYKTFNQFFVFLSKGSSHIDAVVLLLLSSNLILSACFERLKSMLLPLFLLTPASVDFFVFL